MKQLFFRILSLAYISGIFVLADSSRVSDLGAFNPYSLLHIPLYGILAVLLYVSLTPSKYLNISRSKSQGQVSFETGEGHRVQIRKYFLIAGAIATCFAIGDEYYQSFIPSRTASAGDVLLDLAGAVLFLYVLSRFTVSSKRLMA